MMKPHEHVILEVSRERERQMSVEGWSPEHDDAEHSNGALPMHAEQKLAALLAPQQGEERGDA